MSEISSYTTQISLPRAQVATRGGNLMDNQYRTDILQRALAITAEDHGGRISTDIRDADDKVISCRTGIVTPKVPRGVGLRVDESGAVSFVHETRDDNQGLARALAWEISANYNAIALQMALEKMNMAPIMDVGRQNNGRKTIIIQGRC